MKESHHSQRIDVLLRTPILHSVMI